MTGQTFTLRLDTGLRERLQRRADADRRTLANLIQKLLAEEDEQYHGTKQHLNGHAHKPQRAAASK